jgi:hypothetical protein
MLWTAPLPAREYHSFGGPTAQSPLSLRPLRNAANTLCESSGERLLMIQSLAEYRVSTEAQSVSGRFEAFVYCEEDVQQVTVYQNGDRHSAVGPWAFHQSQID